MSRVAGVIVVGLFLGMFAAAKTNAAPKTIEERIAEYGEAVRQRLDPKFRAAGVPYPPKRVTLIGLKQERLLELHASGADDVPRFICAYPVLAASGKLGPKLREGDRQVPEGIYGVQELNPNSRFHLSLWLDYPNKFDRARAVADRRRKLGGEIMIHGNAVSKGCFAMGDPAAEDLFVLAVFTGIANVKVIFAPVDFRIQSAPVLPNETPAWTTRLYQELTRELARYPRRAQEGKNNAR